MISFSLLALGSITFLVVVAAAIVLGVVSGRRGEPIGCLASCGTLALMFFAGLFGIAIVIAFATRGSGRHHVHVRSSRDFEHRIERRVQDFERRVERRADSFGRDLERRVERLGERIERAGERIEREANDMGRRIERGAERAGRRFERSWEFD